MSSLGVASVVTLQFGAHANAVGAHYWNIQDDAHGGDDDGDDGDGESSIEWRVEYAERGAASASGETSSYVPRVVMFDARGMIARTTTTGSRAAASAEAASAAEGTWGGRCSVFRAPLAKRSAFVLALEREAKAREAEAAVRKIARGEDSEAEEEEARELGRRKLGGVGRALERGSKGRERATLEDPEDVKRELIEAASKLDVEADHWSDYLKVELRAKNAFALAGRWEGVDAFEGFGEGLEWIDSEDRREDVRDAVRYWAEDCDTLGGFRILCDDSTAFGGVCARALEDIRDDYDGRTVSVFSVRPPAVREKKRVDMLNAAFASTTLAGLSDLYCPLAACDDYPTMAGLRRNGWFHASSVAALAIEGITTPWRLKSSGSSEAMSMHEMARFMTNRAPGPHTSARMSAPSPTVRGAEDAEALARSMRSVTPAMPMRRDDDDDDFTPFAEYFIARGVSDDATVVNSVLDGVLSKELYRCPRRRCVVGDAIPIPLPFPKIFSPDDPSSVSALIRLTASSATSRVLDAIERDFARASASAVGKATLAAWSVDAVERTETIETLISTARAYAGDSDDVDF